jgi:hypothetical protein
MYVCKRLFTYVHTLTNDLYIYRVFYSIKFEPDKHFFIVGLDRSTGKATVYWLDGSGFEPRWDKIFSLLQLSISAQGPIQPPVQCPSVLFPGLKQLGLDVNHPSPCSAEVKERVHP